MEIEIQLTDQALAELISPPQHAGAAGAWMEFRGVVRGEEDAQPIRALEYEAYPEMAVREMRRILETLAVPHPCLAVKVIHRTGLIPVGETAIYVGVVAAHRAEAIALLGGFMDRLKQDVPIWKRRVLPGTTPEHGSANPSALESRPLGPAEPASLQTTAGHRPALPPPDRGSVSRSSLVGRETVGESQRRLEFARAAGHRPALLSLDEALAEIRARCPPLPAVRAPLAEGSGRVLREAVCASEDWPPFDRSTRDGYAILAGDPAETFSVVDTVHAGDWRPRRLGPGEAVRVATGAALPGGGLRVAMQENVERHGDQIRLRRRDEAANISFRGEDFRAGAPLLPAGTTLNAGALALLATAGKATPLVSPRVRVMHFTTGDELAPPGQTPKPGQIRDANSILIRGLLQNSTGDLAQGHLPEDFDLAKAEVESRKSEIERADLLLISGGASVGERDFTRRLLQQLGFELVFSQVNLRPGRPLILGVNGARVAFGLPGNPLSHFVCFHWAVATALAGLTGGTGRVFFRGQLAAKLDDPPCPRETLWPAKREGNSGGIPRLHPLAWANSSNVACLATANALVRVPPGRGSVDPFVEVDFLPLGAMLGR